MIDVIIVAQTIQEYCMPKETLQLIIINTRLLHYTCQQYTVCIAAYSFFSAKFSDV